MQFSPTDEKLVTSLTLHFLLSQLIQSRNFTFEEGSDGLSDTARLYIRFLFVKIGGLIKVLHLDCEYIHKAPISTVASSQKRPVHYDMFPSVPSALSVKHLVSTQFQGSLKVHLVKCI